MAELECKMSELSPCIFLLMSKTARFSSLFFFYEEAPFCGSSASPTGGKDHLSRQGTSFRVCVSRSALLADRLRCLLQGRSAKAMLRIGITAGALVHPRRGRWGPRLRRGRRPTRGPPGNWPRSYRGRSAHDW